MFVFVFFCMGRRLFKLVILGVSVEPDDPSSSSSPSSRNHLVYLEVKAEREAKQTMSLGSFSFAGSSREVPLSFSYVASSPIRIRAFARARLLTADLGVHSLYEHLQSGAPSLHGTLVFGARQPGLGLVRVRYRLARAAFRFSVSLSEARCLKLSSWWPGPEQLVCRVAGAQFALGSFRALDSSPAAWQEAFQLAVVARSTASFWASRSMCGPREVGRVTFVPGDEIEGQSPKVLSVETADGTVSTETTPEGHVLATVCLAQRYVFIFHIVVEEADEDEEPLAHVVAETGALSAASSIQPLAATPNRVEVLVDGLQTFERYFDVLMEARHSISILAWELSLSFGLITAERSGTRLPKTTPPNTRWVSLEDVMLAKALEGVVVRVVVWRHKLLSYVNRFLYLGDVSIEAEVKKLIQRGAALGVSVTMVHSSSSSGVTGPSARFADLQGELHQRPTIVVVVVGNPHGVLSSHHEKLVLVDAECAGAHGTAFVGGFDIARGRYDQPLHQIPRPYFVVGPPQKSDPPRYTGPSVQPILRRIRFLWHDVQVMLKGPIVQQLLLHFSQRWTFAFSGNAAATRALMAVSPSPRHLCDHHHEEEEGKSGDGLSQVQLVRCWRGVLDVQMMFDAHRQMIRRAKKFLFIEHQYPFHNWGLSYEMCEALRTNPGLKIVIVTAVKTDLPTGLVGDLVDWSQDHITQHLLHIEKLAPDRVLVVGLCRQDEYRKLIKPIYVHSKLVIVDDELIVTGSANMDDMSFFYSSELTLNIADARLAKDTRLRLASEHLGSPSPESFDGMFEAFRAMATANADALRSDKPLVGRLVFMAPKANLSLLLSRVYYPNKLSKALYKLGLDTEEWVDYALAKLPQKLRSKL